MSDLTNYALFEGGFDEPRVRYHETLAIGRLLIRWRFGFEPCGLEMWLDRMLKDRQEILVLGELVLFLAAWGFGIAAAIDDYRVRTNAKAANSVAAKVDFSGAKFTDPSFGDPGFSNNRSEFE